MASGFQSRSSLRVGKVRLGPYCHPMRTRDAAEFGLFKAGIGLMRIFPAGVVLEVLRGAGRWAVRHGRWRSDVAASQLAAAYPALKEEQRAGLLAGLYDHLARTVHEVFIRPVGLEQVRVPDDWAAFDAALAQGRGLILASLHFGNFELCGRVIAARCDLLDVVKPQRNRLFDRYLERMRGRFGIATVPKDRSGPAVRKHLRLGRVVSLLMDQDAGDKGVVVDFLGRPASTWPGAARLAVRADCPVLPVGLVRGPGGGNDLVFGTLIDPRNLTEEQREPLALTARITRELEAFVRAHPEQWFWVHRRWKGAEAAQKETAGSG